MLKAQEKLIMAGLMIPETEKKRLQETAKRRGITLTDLLLKGGLMLAEFSDGFLEQIEKIAETTRLSVSQTIIQLLLVYVSKDAATLKARKRSDTFELAFRYDKNGLITGDQLSDMVFDEQKAALKDLYDRWEANKKKRPGQGMVLTERDEEIFIGVATQIVEKRASI